MKKLNYILSILTIVFAISSCVDEDKYYETPRASFYIDSEEALILDQVTFYNDGEGQSFSLYTGEPGRVFGEVGSQGVPFDSDSLQYAYQHSGTFRATLVANGFNESDNTVSRDTISHTIVIIDSISDLLSIDFRLEGQAMIASDGGQQLYTQRSFPEGDVITFPVYHYSEFMDTKMLRPVRSFDDLRIVPRINKNLGVNSVITVEGVDGFVNDKTIVKHADSETDIFKPLVYSVMSANGEYKSEYRVSPIPIPSFESLLLDGTPLILEIDEIIYNQFNTTLLVPEGTDVSAMIATFGNFIQGVEVEVDGVTQESGVTANDFTNPVVYDLTYRLPGHEDDFVSRSKVKVNVKVNVEVE